MRGDGLDSVSRMKSVSCLRLGLAVGGGVLATLAVCGGAYAWGATTVCVSVASDGTPGNATSQRPAISADGRFVAFESDASNLAAVGTNRISRVYRHDRRTGQTVCVSVPSNGLLGDGSGDTAAISGDGRFVAFHSQSSSTRQVYVRDLGALAIAGNASLVTVSWPLALGATLQTNRNLHSTNWTAYGGAKTNLGGTTSIAVAAPKDNLFFRLY
jgi:hypothetical protein